jgi:hypothetical protein
MENPLLSGSAIQKIWTPERIKDINSPFYPLCASGSVLPFIDSEDLLFEMYASAGLRSEVKYFCKNKNWVGKPIYTLITEKTLKSLIRSMCNSQQARRMLVTAANDIEVYTAIWRFVKKIDPAIVELFSQRCFTKGNKLYIDHTKIREIYESIGEVESSTSRKSAMYLTSAFAMLQPEICYELFSELANSYPESIDILGLIAQPSCPAHLDDFSPKDPLLKSEPNINQVAGKTNADTPSQMQPMFAGESQVACWVLNSDNVLAKAASFDESYENFTSSAKKLLALENIYSFDESGEAVNLLTGLELERSAINSQFYSIKETISGDCDNHLGQVCELKEILTGKELGLLCTREQMSIKLTEFRNKREVVLQNVRSSIEELEENDKLIRDLHLVLDLAYVDFSRDYKKILPCSIFAALQESRGKLLAMHRTVDKEFRLRKASLLSFCEQLINDSGAKSVRLCPEVLAVRAHILSATNLDEIKILAHELDALRELNSPSAAISLSELADIVLNNLEDSNNFVNLCTALIKNDEGEVAFLMTHMWQRLHAQGNPLISIDVALDIVLSSACRAARGQIPVTVVSKALLLDPWLLGLSRGEIQSSDVLQRLVIMLLGGALDDYEGTVAIILTNVGASDLCRVDLPKKLHDFLRAVVARRTVKLISIGEVNQKRQQENDINERISIKNNKYRHLQCANAVHFSRFEALRVFPALENFWHDVSGLLRNENYVKAHATANAIQIEEWYRELSRQHDRPVDEHAHFPVRIRAFMEEFVNLVREHISYIENLVGIGQFLVTETDLINDLKEWAGDQEERKLLGFVTLQNLKLSLPDRVAQQSLWSALQICKPILAKCPHVAVWIRSQETPEVDPILERLVLQDLKNDYTSEQVTSILFEDSAWQQLSILYPEIPGLPAQDWAAKHQEDVVELGSRRADVVAMLNQHILETFDKCVQDIRFPAAKAILKHCSEQSASSKSQGKLLLSSFVTNQFRLIDGVKDAAAEANMPEQWQTDIGELAATIERQLRSLRRSDLPSTEALNAETLRLSSAVSALQFVVEQHTFILDEVRHHLIITKIAEAKNIAVQSPESRLETYQKCPELAKSWSALLADSSDENEIKRTWSQFVKEFAKICNLYRDESDEKKRFVSVTSVRLPFLVFQTAFHKPQSDFLKRPLRLYLYRQNEIDAPALQRLEAELTSESSAAWLHVVFAPQGAPKLKRYFQYDRGFKDFLIVDDNLLYHIMAIEKHDVPLRQALHFSVADLASSSPFVAQGYCHQSNNIYVGRKDILTKLLNTPQAMIWGGRRIGKTSVLHALEGALSNRKYNVAYVYVDLQDNGDPDLAIAQKIASTLGLDHVKSLTEFERQITEKRLKGERFAFLIDEVDEYIKKSRRIHGSDYPLATVLRQLVMDDASKDTVLVYSGYHQLFYEAKLNKNKRRVGHPFINIAQDVPIRDLTHDDVAELVRTGFEEMLGISVSPDVPALISIRASRHPAFVQQFCRCLLDQVSRRRSPGLRVSITKDDVEAVYSASASYEGGEQPFIFYVNETLGYNLSHLGRAIMITICLDPDHQLHSENREKYFSINKIRDELNVWCEVIGIENPYGDHFQQSVELLMMTNMLTQNPQEHSEYRVTYPTYIDILRRLDSLKKANVEGSLIEYDACERSVGVLL